MLHERSPDCGDRQKAAVRFPRAPPPDKHVMRGPSTRIWPSRDTPEALPISLTSASRALIGSLTGQGWPILHDPSNSLDATPDSRTCGPSAHQIGPSPSQTRTGVHSNHCPAGTTAAARSKPNMIMTQANYITASQSGLLRPAQTAR
jgi:hypothetical protein